MSSPSGVALKHLADTLAYSSTIRVTLVAQTVDVPKSGWVIRESLNQWALFRSISIWFDENIRLYVVLRLDSNWSKLAMLKHPDVDSPQDLCRINLPKGEVIVRAPGPLIRVIIAKVRSTGTAVAVVITNHAVHHVISMGSWGEDL